MKTYMFHGPDGPQEGAALVFAFTARQARAVGFAAMGDELAGGEWIESRVKLIKDSPWLFADADKAKLGLGIPHCIDSPRSCDHCECWGKEMETPSTCKDCAHDMRLDEEMRLAESARINAALQTKEAHP